MFNKTSFIKAEKAITLNAIRSSDKHDSKTHVGKQNSFNSTFPVFRYKSSKVTVSNKSHSHGILSYFNHQ